MIRHIFCIYQFMTDLFEYKPKYPGPHLYHMDKTLRQQFFHGCGGILPEENLKSI